MSTLYNVGTDSEGGEQEAEGAILTQAEGDRRREPQPPQRAHALSRYCSSSRSRDEWPVLKSYFGKFKLQKNLSLPYQTQKLLSNNVISVFQFLHNNNQLPFSSSTRVTIHQRHHP